MIPANISIPLDSVAYVNGKVWTVDAHQPWAEAFIVTPSAKFAVIGSTEEINRHIQSSQLITVDLNGSFVMPGMHDSHVHTFHSGLHILSDVNMDFETNSSTLNRHMHEGFGACAFHHTYEDWIVGVLDLVEDYDRSLLDGDWPDNPVLVHGGGGHVKYLNTAALERLGFNVSGEEDGDRRLFGRRPDGSLTGAISGQRAMGDVSLGVPRPSLSHVKRALLRASKELHRNGVTSVQEAAAGRLFLEAVRDLDHEGQLKMDYSTHILFRNEWLTSEVREDPDEIIAMAEEYASTHVDTRFVKVMMDGAPFSIKNTMSSLDAQGNIDTSTLLEPAIADKLEKWDSAGMSCKIHCLGDSAARHTLNTIAEIRENNPAGPQHEIAHCVSVQPDDIVRFRDLNVTAEMSPAMHYQTKFEPPILGYNWTGMVAAQNLVTVGSDWAFGMDLSIISHVSHLVDQIGAEKIIEMLTINGAKSVGKDSVYGSISVGKTASFITLDRNLLEGDFENATVTKTWFEGEVVFDINGVHV
ncbi:hypothetical protein IAQ61_001585 [Plenodomus lingam]|uniref:Similar to amidohydrolase 3 n=1 Tax=Leptosphaeria maculans (strain JN3 / isolate v23.1.3 / race Av1-4-5-6-7-8) TaxID=985895 RepID=E4ZFQ4_LEPMJ|nr:similar to amidohydrolase 3 [Plenodomus lingam JN3]KAH9878314.1 hypothetical protein IAQ61_001585 [Plenodomus lingam]CBX90124.1 similar to amidohydrolase 3 [Plenodomus lingam JN3]